MAELERFQGGVDAVWEAFDRDGGLIVENFISPELLCEEDYQAMGDRYLGAKDYWLSTVTAIFALTDFTEANGATVIALGSNH